MRLFFWMVLTGLSFHSSAQYRVEGQLVQSASGEAIEDATVFLMLKDSVLSVTTSDKRGYFLLTAPAAKGLILTITHVAYQTFRRELSPDSLINLRIPLEPIVNVTDEVIVQATRMGKTLPGTHSDISKKEIEKSNVGQDLPYLLNLVPGTVVNSDAGAGIGYTGIRIRGVDATRINVTINGIPVNDAESQGMFWVNMPDFATSVQNIQVQRGVGTSTNGAAAFGATINMQTNSVQRSPFAELGYGVGFLQNNRSGKKPGAWSLNTQKRNVLFGTGLLENNWSYEGRLSQIVSDGFIDRSSSNLQSWYFSGAHYGTRSVLKMNVFSGREVTYQAWNGIPEPKVMGDEEGLKQYYGFDDSAHLAASGNRTYNAYRYDNEVDNYQQTHIHLHYSYRILSDLTANLSLHTTLGEGYYEQFRAGDDLADYGLQDVVIGGDTLTSTDLIRRRWLDNTFSGLVYSLNYTSKKWMLTAGGGYNIYKGKHFGEVIWARYASNGNIRHRYYDNDAVKDDLNVYAKAGYAITKKINVFLDLQYRDIGYSFLGFDTDGVNVTQSVTYGFFNPKAGLTYRPSGNKEVYLTWSRAHREPVRSDFTESSPLTRPRPERLDDIELGYVYENRKHRLQAVAYAMLYKDQLILTGQINDVGAYTRTNVDKSYRAGLELEYALNISKRFQWAATAALSRNKVKRFDEYVGNWDDGTEQKFTYTNTDIGFSPSVVLSSMFRVRFTEGIELDWIAKYVSRQYLDNTQQETRSLRPFLVNDLRLNLFRKKVLYTKEVRVSLLAANILNAEYEPNGYSFSGIMGGTRYDYNYLFPQAGTNFLLQAVLAF